MSEQYIVVETDPFKAVCLRDTSLELWKMAKFYENTRYIKCLYYARVGREAQPTSFKPLKEVLNWFYENNDVLISFNDAGCTVKNAGSVKQVLYNLSTLPNINTQELNIKYDKESKTAMVTYLNNGIN